MWLTQSSLKISIGFNILSTDISTITLPFLIESDLKKKKRALTNSIRKTTNITLCITALLQYLIKSSGIAKKFQDICLKDILISLCFPVII